MKILVTGGGGFLGRYVVRLLLDRGYEVRILGRSKQVDLEAMGVQVICGDVGDVDVVKRACENVNAVFHVAARAGVWGSWEDFYNPNVIGTRNILGACRETGVGYLVYTSTPSVVFSGESFEGADESLPYGRNWLCHYAHTKAIAEKEVLDAHNEAGLKTVALRPHLIWGPGDPHLLPRVIERARQGRLRIVGDGHNEVDIIHVQNAARAHILALDALMRGVAGGKAYFLSQGEPVVLWDWINDLLERLKIPKISKRISLKNAYRLGAFLEGVYKVLRIKSDPPMTRFVAVELAKSHHFDISAAQRDLGYTVQVSTEEGLRGYVSEFS